MVDIDSGCMMGVCRGGRESGSSREDACKKKPIQIKSTR